MPELAGCGHCNEGFVELEVRPDTYGGKVVITKMYACLCTTGRRRLARTRGVEDVLPPEEIERMYPAGFQAHDTHTLELLAQANVPPAMHRWTIGTYRERFGKSKDAETALSRAEAWLSQPIAERSDWVIMGPNGTGKTGLAVALLRGALDRGHSVQFWTVKHLSIVWRASFDQQLFERRENTRREIELREQIVAPDVLILDEFGGTTLTDFVETTLTEIVDARQKQLRPTLLTLNLSQHDISAGKKRVHERVTALLGPTLADRLRERAQWLPLYGASARRAWGREAAEHEDPRVRD